MLTSNDYLHSMEVKATRKKKTRHEAEQRKVDAEKQKDIRVAEKLQKQAGEYNGRRTLKHKRCSNRNGASMVYLKLARGYSGR